MTNTPSNQGTHAQAHSPRNATSTLDPSSITRLDQRPEVVVENVFLSPRVVDRKAFGELSGELRGIVERAAIERNTISATLDQALATARTIKDSEQAQAGNLALAAKAVKALDERIARATKIIEDAAVATENLRGLDEKAEKLIQGKMSSFEARVQAAQAAAQARVEALEQRIHAASREIEQRLDALRRDTGAAVSANAAALHEAIVKAESLTGQGGALRQLLDRGEAMHQTADGAMRRLEHVQQIACSSRDTMSALLDELSKVMGRVDAQRETLGVEADRVREACKQAGQAIDQKLIAVQGIVMAVSEDARAAADTALVEIKPRIEQATKEIAQAALDTSAILAESRETSDALRSLVAQAGDASNTAAVSLRLVDKASAQIAALLASLEPWRKFLDNEGEVPAPMRAILDTVRSDLKKDLSSIAQALRDAASSAERTAMAVDAPISTNVPEPAEIGVRVVNLLDETYESADSIDARADFSSIEAPAEQTPTVDASAFPDVWDASAAD